MKIAYILPSFSGDFEMPNGGVESAAINLMWGILVADNDVKMFLLYPNTNQIIINVPERITAVPINSTFKSVWTYNYPLIGICKHIERSIVTINPDVVHVQSAPGFYRKFNSNITFLTVHGIPYIDSSFHKRMASNVKSFLTKKIFLNDIKKYRNIIFLVNYGYALLKNDVKQNCNIYFVPNPIIYRRNNILTAKNEIPIFFFSGILRPLKNIEVIIYACNYLKIQGVKFSLKFAGKFSSTAYEQKIKGLINGFNLNAQVVFLGQLTAKDIAIELSKIDVNLLPSFQEVCPMSIIEAMAKGKPSIASSVGGIPEMIFNTYNGYLIPINNAIELANKIKSIIVPITYESMKENCLKMAEVYDYVNIANRTLQCYKKISK